MAATPKKIAEQSNKRVCWSLQDTKSLLEALVVMQSQGFNPNDTNEWERSKTSTAFKKKIRKRVLGVRSYKVRKKYSNIKANYVSATKKEKYSTGGGTSKTILYSEYMDQLVGTDN